MRFFTVVAALLAVLFLFLTGCGGGGGSSAAPAGDSQAPAVSITAPANLASVGGTTQVSATATDNVGVTKVEFYLNGALLKSVNAAPFAFGWDTTSLPIGSYTLTAKAYDLANNIGQSSAVTVTVPTPPVPDTQAPEVSISAPANSAVVSGSTTVTVSATDNVAVTRVEFYVNGILQTTLTSGPYNFSWNASTLASGNYTLSAKAYDAAGNVGSTSGVVVTVPDSTAPTVSITAPANGSSVSGNTAVSVSATDNVGVTRVELYVNNSLQASLSAAPYTFSWNTSALTSGNYTLLAKAYDAAGNVGSSSGVVVTVPDTTAPTVSITSPANNATVSGTVAVSASAADNVAVNRVEFYLNGVLKGTSTAAPYSINLDTTSLVKGSYTLVANAYDASGNVGSSTGVGINVPISVAMTMSITGSTAVGTVYLYGTTPQQAYGLTVVATGATITSASRTPLTANAEAPVMLTPTTVALPSTVGFGPGGVMTITFGSVASGAQPSDFHISLVSVLDSTYNPIPIL